MNKYTQLLIGVLSLSYAQISTAQDYDIQLQTVIVKETGKQIVESLEEQKMAHYAYDERYYLILQFDDIPDLRRLEELRDKKVELLGYLPNFAYWANISKDIDLKTLPVRTLVFPKPHYKLSLPLYHEISQEQPAVEELVLFALPFPGINIEKLSKQFANTDFKVKKVTAQHMEIECRKDRVLQLAIHPAIMYLEEAPPESNPEDIVGRSLHGIHSLSGGPGIGLDGSGVVISIADDGIAVHPDIKNRVIPHLDSDGPEHHSDMVLGILTGAGNIDQTAMGMAPGAMVHLYDIRTNDHIREAVSNFVNNGATITSTSYGEGCGGQYGSSAQAIDEQVYQYPYLLHCFSAGNEADKSCNSKYGQLIDEEGYTFGNITGGQKAAKNVLAVGNLYYNDRPMRLSSRGPANDGRIKPDLCAYGQGQRSIYPEDAYRSGGGSSAAVPVVAGAAAVLTQLYREQKGTETMPSDLLKPVMLNTAEDIGHPGPDYQFGWGRLQIQRAAEILNKNQYFKGSVGHGQENIHNINIPADAIDLRIMLYWHDPAGNPTAGKALVNDLDLSVKSATGVSIRPWVLSTVVHIDSINKPAYRGMDRINNVEQIGIDFPKGSHYQIQVKGHLIPQGPQSYYIVYSYRRKALSMTYPVGGESFVPGENQVLRWEAFGLDTPFHLEYRLQGQQWKSIVSNLSPRLRHFNWFVPSQVTGLVEIRIRSGDQEYITPTPFSIMGLPDFEFVYQTENSARIQWSPVKEAKQYDVYRLGERYMELIGTTNETSFSIQTDPGQLHWYSVSARKTPGPQGRRAVAKRYLNLPCEEHIRLKLKFDAYPSETQWELRNQEGLMIDKGGTYEGHAPNSLMEINLCLPYGCYELIVMDSYGDGMCCLGGKGYYELLDETGRILASGASFIREDRKSFCLDKTTDSPPVDPLSITVLEQEQVRCAAGADGRIVVQAGGGQGDYLYTWSNGQTGPELQHIAAGLYTVTVTDGQLTKTLSLNIQEPEPLLIAFDILSNGCEGEGSGQVSATASGGVSPYAYRWSNGSRTSKITGLVAGQYTLTVSDANGCEVIQSITIHPPSNLELTLTVHHPRCPGDANGRLLPNLRGGRSPYQYHWSTGESSVSISQLPPGDYALTVTDANGCEVTALAQLLPPIPIGIEGNVTPVSNSGKGSIQLQVSGGMPAYTYKWSDGSTSANRIGLSNGEYTVTVTDFLSCSLSKTFTVPDATTEPGSVYCLSSGVLATQEWIESVTINQVFFPSGSNRGYKSHIDRPVSLASGRSFYLELLRGQRTNSNLHYWSVWIDFNQNGQLNDPGELVFQSSWLEDYHAAQISVPAHLTGETRMRVSMQWGSHPTPCGNLTWGEVEDFTLLFIQPASPPSGKVISTFPAQVDTKVIPQLQIFPNPVRSDIDMQLNYSDIPIGKGILHLISGQGQVIEKWNWEDLGSNGILSINLSPRILPGIYYLRLQIGQWFEAKRLVVY